MATHTTDYTDTFIRVAEDCPVRKAEVPADKAAGATVASQQFALLHDHPYRLTSDDVTFEVYAERNGVPASERAEARERFFSKGQPCLRSSPLAKRYGFGFHFDAKGRVALVPSGTAEYTAFCNDPQWTQLKAMRNKRA